MKRESKIRAGSHRGNSRIWLEGKWLIDFGFIRGKAWRVDYEGERIIIRASSEGRTISGKGDRPVLDINNPSLTKALPQGTALKVTATAGKIIIEKAAVLTALVALAA